MFSTSLADEVAGTLSNGVDQGLTIALPCTPATVSNGSVNVTTCVITCNSHYTLSNNACVANQSSNNGWGGGGGGGWIAQDFCPNWDLSASHYDGLCTSVPSSTGTNSTGMNQNSSASGSNLVCSIVGSSFTDEFNQGYLYACHIWITTMQTIQQADMTWFLIRSNVAKMISNYAIKVLKRTPNTWAICSFGDIADQTSEMQLYIKLSCQLGLMGINMTDFDPNGLVTRAQFGTLLSRTLWGTRYDWWTPYYIHHLLALQTVGIMNTITDPENMLEVRWYVMLMLMRAEGI